MTKPDHIELIVRGLLVEGNQVLLCQSVKHGHHYLPGGHVEPGEPAAEALRREFLEEAGVQISVGPLLLTTEQLFTQRGCPRHEVTLVFHVERENTGIIASNEPSITFTWASITAIPGSFLPASMARWLSLSAPRPLWLA